MSDADSPTPDSQPPRPWWKLDLLTWVVLGCVGTSLMVENLMLPTEDEEWGSFSLITILFLSHGWPIDCFHSEVEVRPPSWRGGGFPYLDYYPPRIPSAKGKVETRLERTDPFGLLLNILVWIGLLISTASATKSYFNRPAKWHQFSINSILALTAFVALLCANGMYGWVRWHGDAVWEYIPFAIIAFGAWCTFWTAWTLLCRAAGRVLDGRAEGDPQH